MKTPPISICFLLTTIILLMACDRVLITPPPVSQSDMWNCHSETKWDSLSTKENLIGVWEQEFVSCFWFPEKATYVESGALTVEFKSDNTLVVKENGEPRQTSIWKMVNIEIGLFYLEHDPPVRELNGRILFCDDRVEFNASYRDLCDNYFLRIE
ncbi:hypothetical protein [Portibacter lacus]|nr:hypothetical protein [Portibacter lacus]